MNLVFYSYRSKPIQREFVSDIIANKRELFLAEYVLQTKRRALTKLQSKVTKAEKTLRKEEEKIEADAVLFDDFLTETDKNAVEAMKEAERVTAQRLKLVETTKKLTQRKAALQSELCKFDEKLLEFLTMKKFIWSVFSDQTPDDKCSSEIVRKTDELLKVSDHEANFKDLRKNFRSVFTKYKKNY